MAKLHYFVIDDAHRYGLKEAIILQNFRHWLDRNLAEKENIRDGRVWTYNSYTALAELFPYLSSSQIKRCIQNLEEDGILISSSFNKFKPDRTKWYSINDRKYMLDNMGQNWPIDGTNSSDRGTKMADHGTKSSDGWDEIVRPIPHINTDNKTQIVNTDKDYSLREKTDWFIKLWNKCNGTKLRLTQDKCKQVSSRLKTFTAQELVEAVKNRSEDNWIQSKGQSANWDALFRSDKAVDYWLNRKVETGDPF